LDIVDHGCYPMWQKKAMSNSKKIRSAKTQICIAVMISCECTSENGNSEKRKMWPVVEMRRCRRKFSSWFITVYP